MRNIWTSLSALGSGLGLVLLAGCLGQSPPRFPTTPDPSDTTVVNPDPVDTTVNAPVYQVEIVTDTLRHRIVIPASGSPKPDTLVYAISNNELEISLPGGQSLVFESTNPNGSGSGQSPAGEWTVTPGSLPPVNPNSPSAEWVAMGQSLLSDVPLVIGFSGSEMTVNLPADYCPAERLETVLDSTLSQDVSNPSRNCNSVKIAHPTMPGVSADASFVMENNVAKLVFKSPLPGGPTCTFSQPLLPMLLGASANAQSAAAFDACLQASGFTP